MNHIRCAKSGIGILSGATPPAALAEYAATVCWHCEHVPHGDPGRAYICIPGHERIQELGFDDGLYGLLVDDQFTMEPEHPCVDWASIDGPGLRR